MGDILNVNQTCSKEREQWIDTSNFLQKDQYLGEFSNEFPGPNGETIDEKAIVRNNLEIYGKDETDDLIDRRLEEDIEEHSNAEDPHGDRAYTNDKLSQYYKKSEINTFKFVKQDGTTPFTAPQKGVDPTAINHLATKKYVDRVALPKIQEYLNSTEFNNLVNQLIEHYSTIYLPEKIVQLKQEINEQIDQLLLDQNQTDLVVSSSLNDLNTRVDQLRETINNRIQQTVTDIENEIQELNQIISGNISNTITELSDSITNGLNILRNEFIDIIENDELTISNALNNLDERIIDINELMNTPKKVNQLKINGKNLFDNFNKSDYKLLELITNSKLYHIIQLFMQYSSINVTLAPASNSTFSFTITFDNTDYVYNYVDFDTNTIGDNAIHGESLLINNFSNVCGSLIQEFLETIDNNTYTTYFYE